MSNHHEPPKLPLKILRLYCSEERIEELEGDLFEVYNELVEERGINRAKRSYWWMVLTSFRSYAFKKSQMEKKNWLRSMFLFFHHNLVVSRRNLLKNKTTTAINILGLAIGLSAFIGIFQMVQYELSFNKQIPNKERVYRVYTSFSGAFSGTNRGVASGVHTYLSENTPELETSVLFRTYSSSSAIELVDDGGEKFKSDKEAFSIITSPEFFDVIDHYTWLYGDQESSLDEPFELVLTKEQAEKYFPYESLAEVIGKKIIYQDSLEMRVSGIVDRPLTKDDFKFTNFLSFQTIQSSWLKENYRENEWGNTSSSTQLLVKVSQNVSEAQLDSMMSILNQYEADRDEDGDGSWVTTYKLQPLDDMHYNILLGTFDSTGGVADMKTLTATGVVAFILLLIAIFNFINLETAQSTAKSKEVGLRKVMGSSKLSLVGRFLTESTILTLAAALLSIPLAFFGLQYFEEFVPDGFELGLASISFWVFIIALVIVVGFIAGLYPAFVVSSYQPARSLKIKNIFSKGMGSGSSLRKVLIAFQFVASQLLIVCTLAVYWQVNFLLEKDLGFKTDGVIYVNTPYYESSSKRDILVNQIREMPEVESFCQQSNPPSAFSVTTTIVKFKTDTSEVMSNVHRKQGDTSYLKVYGIELLAGENIKPIEGSDEILINETYLHELGFQTPHEAVGVQVGYEEDEKYQIVGVVKDFHMQSLRNKVEPMMFSFSKGNSIAMKVSGDNTQKVIDKLSAAWSDVYAVPLEVEFFDEMLERFYRSENQLSKISSLTTIVAILISCLGLFGLMSFIVVQKSKEMGIRKVLGASIFQIGAIISKEFMILLFVSFAIATPVAWYIINQWMEGFAYQASISFWIYLLGGLVSLIAATLSISIKVWRSAIANPVDSLRYE